METNVEETPGSARTTSASFPTGTSGWESDGSPCATLRSTSTLVRGDASRDVRPRTGRTEPRRGRADPDDKNAGWHRRDRRDPRARSRHPPDHPTGQPRVRLQGRPRVVPVLGEQPRDRGPVGLLPAAVLPRLHARLPLRPVAG